MEEVRDSWKRENRTKGKGDGGSKLARRKFQLPARSIFNKTGELYFLPGVVTQFECKSFTPRPGPPFRNYVCHLPSTIAEIIKYIRVPKCSNEFSSNATATVEDIARRKSKLKGKTFSHLSFPVSPSPFRRICKTISSIRSDFL